MTDEKLDQILKQALAPEIDDREIRVHGRRKGKMRKYGIMISKKQEMLDF